VTLLSCEELSGTFTRLSLDLQLIGDGGSRRIKMSGLDMLLVTHELLVWLGGSRISLVAIVLSGLACSGLYPCFLALTGTLYSRVSGSALGILTTTAGLGGIFICWLTGIISEQTDLGMGFIVPVSCSLAALLIFAVHFRTFYRKEEGFTSA
jgi:FHS family glucose/mannose:H+ symporter-like MFS transporter